MRFLPGNAQHIGARHSQQDSFGFADPEDQAFIRHAGFLAVVCDGMGGMEHGDAASRTAVRAFLDAYQRKTPEESIPAALERSAREANNQVVALAHSFGMSEGIGTTLVGAALQGNSLYFVSVGDSALFHVSGGQIRMLNRPHVFANLLEKAVARGTLSREDADRHPERESLTSFIGAETLEEIDRNTAPLPMQDGDAILLASDGMFKTLETDEILSCLQGHPQSWPENLVARTMSKGREYQDNVTVLSVTAESDTRATTQRTLLMAPLPPAAAGIPPTAQPPLPPPAGSYAQASPPVPEAPPMATNGSDLPRTVRRPSIPSPPAPPLAPMPPSVAQPAIQWSSPAAAPVPPTVQPRRSQSKLLWLAIIFVAALAAAAAGWWFIIRQQHKPVSSVPILSPDRQVKAPKSDQPPDFRPDPNAPLTPAPAPAPSPDVPQK